jgi:hypothetical protein
MILNIILSFYNLQPKPKIPPLPVLWTPLSLGRGAWGEG